MSEASEQLNLMPVTQPPKTTGGEVIPFGKYKGEPVEVLLADRDYCEWLTSQPWLRDRYATVYQTIINYGGEPQDSPEHNEMQAAFLDDEWCLKLAGLLWRTLHFAPSELPTIDAELPPRVAGLSFESRGWDVVYSVYADDDLSGRVAYVECKPDLGDDFPSVLRQIKAYEYEEWPPSQRVLLVRRHRFERVTWDQVVKMFAASNVTVLSESEVAIIATPGTSRR